MRDNEHPRLTVPPIRKILPWVHQVIRKGEDECGERPHAISFPPPEESSDSTTDSTSHSSYEATAPPTATRRHLRQSSGVIYGGPAGETTRENGNHPRLLGAGTSPVDAGGNVPAAVDMASSLAPSSISAFASLSRRGKGAGSGRKLEVARSLLAREVEEGVASSRANDPDLEAKDADLRLLNVSEPSAPKNSFWGRSF